MIFAAVLATPAIASAQSDPARAAHWAVSVSFTPAWEMSDSVKNFLAEDDEEINFRGSEFSIGIGRASRHGGDWSVSFIRKPMKDGVGLSSNSVDCFPGPQQQQVCLTSLEVNMFEQVMMSGVEIHKFIPFVRIKNRVQIGLNVGGGVAQFSGTVRTINDFQDTVFTPGPGGGSVTIVPVHEEETALAKDELMPIFPLFKLEVQGSVILTKALKVKLGGGLNFPGNSFQLGAVYMFGAK